MTKLDPKGIEKAAEAFKSAATGGDFMPRLETAIAAYLDAAGDRPSVTVPVIYGIVPDKDSASGYRLDDAPEPPVSDWLKRKAASEGDLEVSAGWKHVKRGTTYDVIGDAELQSGRPLEEGAILRVYLCRETGRLWARPSDEFHDGRFERLPAAPKGRDTE